MLVRKDQVNCTEDEISSRRRNFSISPSREARGEYFEPVDHVRSKDRSFRERRRRWVVSRTLVRVLSAAVLSVFPLFGVSSSGATAQLRSSSGTLRVVKSTFNFWDVGCPDQGACIAVGQGAHGEGVIVAISHGVPRPTVFVPGTLGLGGVACPRANFCLATGNGTLEPSVVVPVIDGRPGKPIAVPGVFLFALACGSPTTCWATGESTNFAHAVVVHIVNSTIERTYVIGNVAPGAFFGPSSNSPNGGTAYGPTPSCVSATSCVLVGATRPYYGRTQGRGLIVHLVNGVVQTLTSVPGTAQLTGVSCVSVSTCVADGEPPGSYVGLTPGVIVGVTNGIPGHVVSTALGHNLALQLSGMWCEKSMTCFAVTRDGLVVSLLPARTPRVLTIAPAAGAMTGPHQGAPVGFDAVSCNDSSCVAVGGEFDPALPQRAVGALYSF